MLIGGFLKLETEMYKDVGEEIIFKLKLILDKLDKILKKNEEELPDPYISRDRT